MQCVLFVVCALAGVLAVAFPARLKSVTCKWGYPPLKLYAALSPTAYRLVGVAFLVAALSGAVDEWRRGPCACHDTHRTSRESAVGMPLRR